jgi:hypothetical protein
LELVWRDDGQQLIALHGIPFFHEELPDSAGELRTDDGVVGGDDAGEDQRLGTGMDVVVIRAGGDEGTQDQNKTACC